MSSSSETFGEPSSPPSTHDSLISDCEEYPSSLPSIERSNKRARKNTKEEARKMRNDRKKRKRRGRNCFSSGVAASTQSLKSLEALRDELKKEREESNKKLRQVCLYKNMARSYWERWQWELQKRRETLREQQVIARCIPKPCSTQVQAQHTPSSSSLHEIFPDLLQDPPKPDGSTEEEYIGRGSFAVVRLQLYRGFSVAVKEFLPRTVHSDVINEASILNELCHPCLPYLFGVCTSSSPLRIVMQFHGINSKPVTLVQELTTTTRSINDSVGWVLLCTQLIEAVHYLHVQVKVIHNDIKCSNVLLADNPVVLQMSTCTPSSSADVSSNSKEFPLQHHPVLIDFGKATRCTQGRHYKLSEVEKVTYLTRYPHIPPEVVYGDQPQSTFSDVYALGKIFVRMMDYGCFESLRSDVKSKLLELNNNCCSIRYKERPSAKQVLDIIMTFLNDL